MPYKSFQLRSLRGNETATCHFANPAQDGVDDLFADGVVASGVIVGSVFFAADQLLRVEEGVVGPGADLICQEGGGGELADGPHPPKVPFWKGTVDQPQGKVKRRDVEGECPLK